MPSQRPNSRGLRRPVLHATPDQDFNCAPAQKIGPERPWRAQESSGELRRAPASSGGRWRPSESSGELRGSSQKLQEAPGVQGPPGGSTELHKSLESSWELGSRELQKPPEAPKNCGELSRARESFWDLYESPGGAPRCPGEL
eukprot:6100332-Alexandrium_andersonii.AAC.1